MKRIAFLGVAHMHANLWAKAWKKNSSVTLVGVWDEDAELAERFAAEFDIKRFRSMEELLSDTHLDSVGICAENYRHAAYTIAAAEAGKDILCEKPTSTSLDDCRKMQEAVTAAGVRFMQAFPMRVDPVNHAIKSLLEKKEIGKVFSFRKRHGIGWASNGIPDKGLEWFADKEKSGGGALIDEGVHAADFLIWMFGLPKRVTATIPPSISGIKVEDNAIVIAEFDHGIVGTLQSSWAFAAGTVTSEIFGQDGTIIQMSNDCASTTVNGEHNFPLQVYRKHAENRGWEFPRMPINFMHIHEVVADTFIDRLCSGEAFPSTLENGYQALRFITAAYLSAQEHRTIELETVR